MIFDTHAHYDDAAFDEDRDAVLSSLIGKNVGMVIDVAAGVSSLDAVMELTKKYPFVYGSAGLHPDEVGPHSREALSGRIFRYEDEHGKMAEEKTAGLTDAVLGKIRSMLKEPKIVAVGEIGLDYHWNTEPRDVQIECFKKQIDIAISAGKPIIVHSRQAAEDTMRVITGMYGSGREGAKISRAEAERSLLPEEYTDQPGKEWVWRNAVPPGPGRDMERKGIIHAYAYSAEMARIYTGMGFMLGIGGVATYRNSKKLRKVIEEIPLEYLVLETDCPYLTPEPHRGERNDSSMLEFVTGAIAEIKGVSVEEVERITWENAARVFSV
ncbi:MAG: TatD family hydrolase [Lachnospiraceae bacterium]|nr:TatD family hydrolase [Lachnospiraceae bacterium]